MLRQIIRKIRRFMKKCSNDPGYMEMYVFCRMFRFSMDEFHYYNFKGKGLSRFSFISFYESDSIFEKYNKTILNKRETYLLLRKHYRHDCCLIGENDADSEKVLREFIGKHPQFFAKKFRGAGGIGIEKADARDADFSVEEFLAEHREGCLLEEPIRQTMDMACFHPQSVNTLRVTTVNCNGEIESIYPVVRIGMGDCIVDNSHSNCLTCAVDRTSGKIVSAVDYTGRKYVEHPDSGLAVIGSFIPELESAIETAEKLARKFPGNIFTGFDFAHTEEGWILVEANTKSSFSVWQIPYQTGFRKEWKEIRKKYR